MERGEYVRRVLEAYRTAPGTGGAIRGPDRLLAAQLHERGSPNKRCKQKVVRMRSFTSLFYKMVTSLLWSK